MAPSVNDILNNRYRIVASIGRGGMAEVFKVFDEKRAAYLALKLLREDLAQDPIFLRRFQREAKTLAELQHPNIVRFYGLERNGLNAFMLMEYIEGNTLRAELLLRDGKPYNLEETIDIFRPICSALHYAHGLGLAHCDLKPGNIMIEKSGHILLSDFGIARLTEGSTTATLVGAGTPAYMAPEQILGKDPSPQTDIYALGILLYELLTGGERPFTGEQAQTTGTTAEKVRWEKLKLDPAPPSSHNPAVSKEIDSIILRCLQKNPELRFTNTIDLLEALEKVLDSNAPITKTQLSKEIKTVHVSKPVSNNSHPKRSRQKGVFRWVLIGIGLFAFVGMGIVLGSKIGGSSIFATTATQSSKTAATGTITSNVICREGPSELLYGYNIILKPQQVTLLGQNGDWIFFQTEIGNLTCWTQRENIVTGKNSQNLQFVPLP